MSRPILIIDSMNLFLRHFMVNQAVNSDGDLVGGTLGFLKSLRYYVSQFLPKVVYLIWEQGGACPRRRLIYPEYKGKRAKQKDFVNLYNQDGKPNPQADETNKTFQIKLLTKALSHLPICQIYVPEIECDDVIAYLCKNKFATREEEKIIVSSDKDFYQLLEDPKVKIYDPGKKIFISQSYVKQEFNISVRNIVLARCIAGDISDNIEGIEGVGLKTIAKRFVEFADETKDLDVDWLIERCKILKETNKRPPKCYEDIIAGEHILKRNWKLMYLGLGSLNSNQMARVDYRIEEYVPAMNHIDYLKTFTSGNIPITKDIDDISRDLKYLMIK